MIGIFDSGIGGVTVFREILKINPNYKYIYYSDSLHNPYGEKEAEELYVITKNIVQYLIDAGCKIIVIACNTASLMCSDKLRRNFEVPIIAIEPAQKLVYDQKCKGNTLILATKGTIESPKFQELYRNDKMKNVKTYECIGLAELIEQDKKPEIKEYIKTNLSKYRDHRNVVLGCTHYPLITEELKNVFKYATFYDGSLGVAKRLKAVIEEEGINSSNQEIIFVDSSNDINKKERFFKILEDRNE